MRALSANETFSISSGNAPRGNSGVMAATNESTGSTQACAGGAIPLRRIEIVSLAVGLGGTVGLRFCWLHVGTVFLSQLFECFERGFEGPLPRCRRCALAIHNRARDNDVVVALDEMRKFLFHLLTKFFRVGFALFSG